MKTEELLNDLRNVSEMNPDEHDGSYELMREVVKAYAIISDYSVCNFRDLNAIYLMAVGTWRQNAQKKKESVEQSHLPINEKQRLNAVIDRIWDNACKNTYTNREQNKPSIGMFGTGFYSFEKKTTDEDSQKFIKMLTEISGLTDENEIFDKAEPVLKYGIKGMRAASASVILHCLKPYVFPIINGNMGKGNIFEALGISLDHPTDIETYIANCRKIKEFRDENFSFKNYRILDQWVRKLDAYRDDEYFPSLKEYDPGITREQYEDLFQKEDFISKSSLDTVYYLYKLGGEGSCKLISDKYGDVPQHYNSNATYLGKKVLERTNCPVRKVGDETRYWSILFQGKYATKGETGSFIWHLRQPLADAIANLDAEGFFDDMKPEIANEYKEEPEKELFDYNIILYGPPGTGKTFSTVIYAVAIIEGKDVEEVRKEATDDYGAVKARYEKYIETRQIAFTTFHQSYGYEDFIEGIRPVLNAEDDDEANGDVQYEYSSGAFKSFCDIANTPVLKEQAEDLGVNRSPVVWKVSLEGSGENPTRRECFENGHIRIGWDDYGPVIDDKTDFKYGGKKILNAFMNEMQVGDLVLSLYKNTEIDAVGVITGDYDWNDSYSAYKRVRKVKWLFTDKRENILKINNGAVMSLSTVYKMKVAPNDVMDMVRKYTKPGEIEKPKKHVFIIDEINRGNISKIFGELITLIENTKRLGKPEEAKAILPYSKKEFGVPSNVYILGTMNTADRSIALMDTALRRRFSFVEMMPKPELLDEVNVSDDNASVNIGKMLRVINKRIEVLYDREHTIGHAFFMGLKDDPSVEKLSDIFKKSVIPLLQEYFYEDYDKIRMVLGDNAKKNEEDQFIVKKELDWNNDFIGEQPDDIDITDNYFTIKYENFKNVRCYQGIINKL